jgi:hypothetical protein
MNMVSMSGPDPQRSFFDAQKKHNARQESHNTHIEWMMFASLIQQERLIQQQSAQLNQALIANEENKRNRRIDVYVSELLHRGFSPLEANSIAQNEIRYIELVERVTEIVIRCEENINNAAWIIRNQKVTKLGLISSYKYKKESEIFEATKMLEHQFESERDMTLYSAAHALNQMPFSYLFDDYSFRKKIQETTKIIVKLPDQNQEKITSETLDFSDQAVQSLFLQFKSYQSNWEEIHNAKNWRDATKFLPKSFTEEVKKISDIFLEVESDFLNLSVIASEGGFEIEVAQEYLKKIRDDLSDFVIRSSKHVASIEKFVSAQGDSPIGAKLRALLIE